MANLEEEEKAMFYEVMINYFMNNPLLHDKVEERYSFTVEKLEKLMTLSSYLKELNIKKSVPEIVKAWQELVQQFKNYVAKIDKAKSGSAAMQDDDFPYYEHLMFLKPTLQHQPVMSTMSYLSTADSHDDPHQNEFSYYKSNASLNRTNIAGVSCSKQCSLSAKSSSPPNKKSFAACSKSDLKSSYHRLLKVPELDNIAKKN